jgi:hypothetical protein
VSAEDRNTVDERARAAAADLHQLTERRPIPTFETDATIAPAPAATHRRSGRRLLAVAAVVLAVAVAAVVAVTRTDDETKPTEPVQTTQLRSWDVTAVPSGLAVAGAVEDRPDQSAVRGTPMAVYGPEDARPQVGVAGMQGWSVSAMREGGDVEPFEADGVAALDLSASGWAPAAVLIDDPASSGNGIVAVGSGGDRDKLARFAIATTVADGTARVAPDDLPQGWDLLFDEPGGLLATQSTALARSGTTDARLITYAGDLLNGTNQQLTITSRLASERTIDALWLTSEKVEELELDGRPALMARHSLYDGDVTQRTIAWSPSPGEVVSVSGWNLTQAELLEAARSARPLDEDAWEDLAARSQLGLLGFAAGHELDEGTLPDGTRFVLRLQNGEFLELDVAIDPYAAGDAASSTIVGTEEAALRAGTQISRKGRTFQAGIVGPEIDTVVIRADGRQVATATMGQVTLDDRDREEVGVEVAASLEDARWFVVEVIEDADELVLLAVDGGELDRFPIDELGSGSFDEGIGRPTPTTVERGGG